jgi:putative flippase GtrA
MTKEKIKTFLRNIVSSLVSAGIDISLFYILSSVFKREYLYIVLATVIARIISGGVNFLLNRNFVFKANGKIKKELVLYLILFVIIMVSSSLLVASISMKLVNVNQTIIKLVVDLVLFLISFNVQDKFIFKERKVNYEEKRRS